MELSPEEKERIYEEEKARLEAQEKAKEELDKKKQEGKVKIAKKNKRTGIKCTAIILFLVVVSIILGVCLTKKMGSIARIHDPNGWGITVCIDRNVMDEYIRAVLIYDLSGINVLKGSEKIFDVDNNTKVRILQTGEKAVKIRILEGKHAGRSGWVSIDEVKEEKRK